MAIAFSITDYGAFLPSLCFKDHQGNRRKLQELFTLAKHYTKPHQCTMNAIVLTCGRNSEDQRP